MSNLLRIHLKGKSRFGNGSPLKGAMYNFEVMVKLGGGGAFQKILIFHNFLKILMVSDKTIHKAFTIYKTL